MFHDVKIIFQNFLQNNTIIRISSFWLNNNYFNFFVTKTHFIGFYSIEFQFDYWNF